jgi:hypothetical protein
MHDIFHLPANISVLPVVHGSGDFALAVRRVMLEERFDCLAVPLPQSFQENVEQGVLALPAITMVVQRDGAPIESWTREWSPESDGDHDGKDDGDDDGGISYVPVDPCQPVIMALRVALGEHLDRAFIDLETDQFEPYGGVLPDPYALKRVALERFATANLPAIARPQQGQRTARIRHMAARLRALSARYRQVLFVCSLLDWPWIREAYLEEAPAETEHDDVQPTEIYELDPQTLVFLLGELPFITGLYERARSELEDDENLSIDGVKELLISSRARYRAELRGRARSITPHMLRLCVRYIRNLSLLNRRMTPDMYTIIVAAKQIGGDRYALHVAETLRDYPYVQSQGLDQVRMGIDRAGLPGGAVVRTVCRLPGPPISWCDCELQRRPEQDERRQWQLRWNTSSQCSWPPEDERIENFRSHVFERARTIMDADLARSEKFTTSLLDGIDIRETLRNWHTGDLFVKSLPPSRGGLDCVVMLFDSPADPRNYPWRTTWYAEHEQESTLAFYATDFRQEIVGPGIGVGTYGGAMFLYPPVRIADVWTDTRLDFTETLEERLLAAACLHSECPRIALVSAYPPGAGWRRLARRYRKTWVHVPLSQFSDSTLAQLRLVHVLGGHQVRSYATHFIRKA